MLIIKVFLVNIWLTICIGIYKLYGLLVVVNKNKNKLLIKYSTIVCSIFNIISML